MNDTYYHILLILIALSLGVQLIRQTTTREYRHGRRFAREALNGGNILPRELARFAWRGKQNQFTAGMRAELRAFEERARDEK